MTSEHKNSELILLDEIGALTEEQYKALSEKELSLTKYCKGEVNWTQGNQCSDSNCAAFMGQARSFPCNGDECTLDENKVYGWTTKKPCKDLVNGQNSAGTSYVACKVKFKKIKDCG